MEGILAYMVLFGLSSFESKNLFFYCSTLRCNHVLSYNSHYFLRIGEEKAVIIPAFDAAETKVLTETDLMSFLR